MIEGLEGRTCGIVPQEVKRSGNKAKHVTAMSELNQRAEKDRRELTIDEKRMWESMESEVRRLEAEINRDEIQERREAEMARIADHNGRTGRHGDPLTA